ncbi:Mitogen-activated protein kinase kinase kinase 3 [Platysternon megacephalum]|uniref:Mitogen-activated protein kinase kinase kinase 3 n=1 Tax=Platysternon megacephalum TaxID=55544 RepID=A0A4D9E6X5_9SAUR|nr:Mitogen-activated protein kinase kinase kinase 3 [Platysternon megacephalum]
MGDGLGEKEQFVPSSLLCHCSTSPSIPRAASQASPFPPHSTQSVEGKPGFKRHLPAAFTGAALKLSTVHRRSPQSRALNYLQFLAMTPNAKTFMAGMDYESWKVMPRSHGWSLGG